MFGLRNLQHLKLDGKVRKLSKVAGEQGSYMLHNLTKLELENSGMCQEHVNLIAKVPNLADLVLGEGSYTEDVLEIPTDGFPELKELQINKLNKLTQWTVAQAAGSALKQLQRVSILNCTALTNIPNHLKTLENLVLLVVHNSPNLNFPLKGEFDSGEKLLIFTEENAEEVNQAKACEPNAVMPDNVCRST
jgi:hypothetical protein